MRQDIQKAVNYYWGIKVKHAFVRKDKGADYRHACFFCGFPRRHRVHGLEEGHPREPVSVANPDDAVPSAERVRRCYAAIIDVIDEYNELIDNPDDRVMIPFPLQEVLAAYIKEQEALKSIKEAL